MSASPDGLINASSSSSSSLSRTYPSSIDVSRTNVNGHETPHHHTALNRELVGENNVMNLKIQLQEAFVKLEERNILISKAKNAMEGLSTEVNRLRLEVAKADGNESKLVKQLKRDAEEIGHLAARCSLLEQDNLSLKTVIREKDTVIESQNDHCEQKDASVKVLLQKLEDRRGDFDKMEQEKMHTDNQLQQCENELMSLRAQGEVFKMQYGQTKADAERYLELHSDEVASRDKRINEHTLIIGELNTKYGLIIEEKEAEYARRIASLQKEKDDTIERLIKAHNAATEEIDKRTSNHISNTENRAAHDLETAIREKNNELHRLQNTLDKEEIRVVEMKAELSEWKAKVPPLHEAIENKKHEINSLSQELLLAKDENARTKADNLVYNTKLADLEAALEQYREVKIKDDLEKVEQQLKIQFKLKQTHDDLEVANRRITEMMDSHNQNQSIHANNALELNDLKMKVHCMEDTVRENERLKNTINNFKTENDSLATELSRLRTDHESYVEKCAGHEHEYNQLIGVKDGMNQQLYVLRGTNKHLETSLNDERVSVKSLTSSLGILTERYTLEKLMREKLLGQIEECIAMVDKVDVAVRSILEENLAVISGTAVSTPRLPSTDDHLVVPSIDSVYTGLSDITHSISSRADRLQSNIDRIKRLKGTFEMKVMGIVSSHEGKEDLFQTKYNLFMAKLQEKESRIDMLRQTLERDQMHTRKHAEENQNFIDLTSRQHKEMLQEIERKKDEEIVKHLADIEKNKHHSIAKEQDLMNRMFEIEAENKKMIEKLSEKYEVKALLLANESKDKYQTFENLMNGKIDQKDRHIKGLEEEIASLKDQIATHLATVTELEALSKGLAGDIEDFMKSDEDKIRDKHLTTENYRSEIMKLEEKSHLMISKFNDAMTECGRLSHDLENSQKALKELQTQHSDLVKMYNALEGHSDDKLGSASSTILGLQEQIESLKSQLDQLDMRFDEKSRECVNANAKISVMRARIEDLESQVVDPGIQQLLHETNKVFQNSKIRRQSFNSNSDSVEQSNQQINSLITGSKPPAAVSVTSSSEGMPAPRPVAAASASSHSLSAPIGDRAISQNHLSPTSHHNMNDVAPSVYDQHRMHDLGSTQSSHHHHHHQSSGSSAQPHNRHHHRSSLAHGGPISPIPFQYNHATTTGMHSQSSTPSHSNSSFMTGYSPNTSSAISNSSVLDKYFLGSSGPLLVPTPPAKQHTSQTTPAAINSSITNRTVAAGSNATKGGNTSSKGPSINRKENSTPVNVKVIESATKIGQLSRNISALQKKLDSFAI